MVMYLFSPLFAQKNISGYKTTVPDSTLKSFGLFESDIPIEISLQFDLSTYLRTKPKEDYLKAKITFHISNTDSIKRSVLLRTRGVFRNQYCTFSPIELNFKKADFGYSDLNRISKIKLVPECRYGSQNENYVLREYLVYKLFNVLTDTSFRVRLLTITYLDSEKKKKPVKQFGFFIEPVEMLTSRTNTIQVSSGNITQKNIVPEIMDRIAIFNYMIGNYDWSIPGQHNIKVIKSLVVIDSVPLGIAVPYDFDWTGIVDAAYAIPAENVGTQSVRERIFQGICRRREVYQKALAEFSYHKPEFYKVINDFQYLNQNEKREMTDYLDEFFIQLGGRSHLLDYLVNACKDF